MFRRAAEVTAIPPRRHCRRVGWRRAEPARPSESQADPTAEIERATDQCAESDVAPRAVQTPSGSVAATEAFAWMNRQLSWQSTLADLEAKAAVCWMEDANDYARNRPHRPDRAQPG
jgi:hypothetical protein